MKIFHIIITFILGAFSTFEGFVYFCRHIEKEEVNVPELREQIKQSPTLKKYFGL